MTNNFMKLEEMKVDLQERRRILKDEVEQVRAKADLLVGNIEQNTINGIDNKKLLNELGELHKEAEHKERVINKMASPTFESEHLRGNKEALKLMNDIKKNNAEQLAKLQDEYTKTVEQITTKNDEVLKLIKDLGVIYQEGKTYQREILEANRIMNIKQYQRGLEPEVDIYKKKGFPYIASEEVVNAFKSGF